LLYMVTTPPLPYWDITGAKFVMAWRKWSWRVASRHVVG
jgi:hypothetical protein